MNNITQVVPHSIPCDKKVNTKYCSGYATICDYHGNLAKYGQEPVYHFLNTKEPYMLRHCSRCDSWKLVVINSGR